MKPPVSREADLHFRADEKARERKVAADNRKIAEKVARAEIDVLESLKFAREEISKVNAAAGETVFNPAAKDALDAVIRDIAGIEWNPYDRVGQRDPVDHYVYAARR